MLDRITYTRYTKELYSASKHGGKAFARLIRLLHQYDILVHYMPEIAILNHLEQNKEHHPEGNVFEHTMLCLEETTSTEFDTLMSILYHDVGKSVVYNEKTLQFHGHGDAGVDIIVKASERLQLSNKTRDCMIFCSDNHMKLHIVKEMKKSKIIKMKENEYFDILLEVHRCDCSSKRGTDNIEYINSIQFTPSNIKNFALDITGNDVIGLGFSQGPEIGKILRFLTERVLDYNEENTKENLLYLIKNNF